MTQSPRFTIAIPTYNNEATVANAIRSALGQDYRGDYEVLVVNNASTDGTLGQAEQFVPDPRLTIVTNESTCSLYANHNVCLQQAKGDYVLFCHSDDTLDPGALRSIHRALEQRGFPRRIVMWGHSLYIDFYDELNNAGFRAGQLFSGIVAARAFFDMGLTPSGTCYCRSIADHGGFLVTAAKAAPSDASSMVLAALNGFRFEMIEDIIFFRYTASTATHGRPFTEIISAHEDAFRLLFSKLNHSTVDTLIAQNSQRTRPSLLFLNSVSILFPAKALRKVLIYVLRRPFSIRGQAMRAILYRIVKNYFRRDQCKR